MDLSLIVRSGTSVFTLLSNAAPGTALSDLYTTLDQASLMGADTDRDDWRAALLGDPGRVVMLGYEQSMEEDGELQFLRLSDAIVSHLAVGFRK